MPPRTVQLSLLGRFEARRDDGSPAPPIPKKARALLAYLAVELDVAAAFLAPSGLDLGALALALAYLVTRALFVASVVLGAGWVAAHVIARPGKRRRPAKQDQRPK